MKIVPEDGELWKFHPRWAAYEISTMGRVRSYWRKTGAGWIVDLTRTPKIRVTSLGTRGHRYLPLIEYRDGQRIQQTCQIHGLVLETFVGPRPEGMQACHNNGIPDDNRLENLRWDTHSANTIDSIVHGTHPVAILDFEAVRDIWSRLSVGQSIASIARRYSVTRGTVTQIKLGHNWSHLTSTLPPLPDNVAHPGTGLPPDPIYAPQEIRDSTVEIWRLIPGFSAYKASTFGKIASCLKAAGYGGGWRQSDTWKEARLTINTDGYYRVSARSDDGKARSPVVHRLILSTFAGPCPPGFVGCHGDGDKTNNFIDNLRWDSLSANARDHRGATASQP